MGEVKVEQIYLEDYVRVDVQIDNIPDLGDKTGEGFLNNLEKAISEGRKLINEGFKLVNFWSDQNSGVEFSFHKKNEFDVAKGYLVLNKFLIPTDGSENALRAAQYVTSLARNNSDLVVTILSVASSKDVSIAQKAIEKTKEIFDKQNILVETVVISGEAGPTIVKFARQGGFGQIVMGTRGRSGLKGILMGSVSQQVLNMSEIPVILVK